MSPRCAGLVRAANRSVKMLVITDQNLKYPGNIEFLKNKINFYSLACSPTIQPLMDIPGEPSFPDYPLTSARLSKWHCLVIDLAEPIDTATIEQIVNNFSAVTDLKFITRNSEHLVPLLQHPKWQCQLTHFMAPPRMRLAGPQRREMTTAINNLTALQYLALKLFNSSDLPDLTILAQLKQVVYQSTYLEYFVRSLERYATDNADLQIHLNSSKTEALLTLSQPLRSRIVRYKGRELDYTRHNVPLLCSQFHSLTSISFFNRIAMTGVVPLFTALSQLHQLVHLGLGLDLRSGGGELPLQARPLAQLNTLRALELTLAISDHSQVQWLKLPVRMPNLQSIFIEGFSCDSCKVEIHKYPLIPFSRHINPVNSSKAQNCLPSSLFTLHPGVPLNRLILESAGECISAEKLLFQYAGEPSVSTAQR